jgi:hypothetical protein
MKSFTWAIVQGVVVEVFDGAATDVEWVKLVDGMVAAGPQLKAVLAVNYSGGGPSANQRSELNRVLGGKMLRVAIVSDSAIARGILTAISWLTPSAKRFPQDVFKLGDMEKAYAFLQLAAPAEAEVRTTVRRLSAEVGK